MVKKYGRKYSKKKVEKKNLPDELIDNYEEELKTVLDKDEINNLKKTLTDLYNTTNTAQVNIYMSFVIDEIRKFNSQKPKLDFEARLADKIYNQFMQDGGDDLNINGRLLAANLIKFNKIIEQNDEIIRLLTEIKE